MRGSVLQVLRDRRLFTAADREGWRECGAPNVQQTKRVAASRDRLYITLVFFGAHQRVELLRIGELELEEPALAFRVLVDRRRRRLERVIDGNHLAADRAVDLARRLDRFD